MSKPDFGVLKIKLQETLYNLYNPVFEPADCVFEVTGCSPDQGLEPVRAKIIDAIKEMGGGIPGGESLPLTSKSRLDANLLDYRFLKLRSQEQTSELLSFSARHLRRKQQEAVAALALKLWKKRYPSESTVSGQVAGSAEMEDQNEAGVFRAGALLREIEVLNTNAPSATANLGKVVRKAVEMMVYLLDNTHTRINLLEIPETLEVSVHPTMLRQVILYTVECISQSGCAGDVNISARGEADSAVISFSTCDARAPVLRPQVNELIDVLGGKVDTRQDPNGCILELSFTRTEKMHVLVIDDNLELVGLYRRFVANTQYEIIHLPSGSDLLEQIKSSQPDVIVMDILLPDIDGWDLLMQIQQHHPNPSIPVVVCSVIGDEHMATSLGASGYLTKPVERRDFIQMLDKVCRTRQVASN
ncbi:MAG: response regulator [Chloroflexi bacterium]|nr:response regulator [Chloroflexota bacterium]